MSNSICKTCVNGVSKGGWCSELISSNGHTTWATPVPEDDYRNNLEEFCGENYPELFSPNEQTGCAAYKTE